MASSPPAVVSHNQPANTIPKALRKLKPEMRGMAMSLCELISDNIDADKALTLINCCYFCPGSINNRIRREYFCYSKLAWKTRTTSELMHDYIKPFLMAKHNGTIEEFQSEFVTKCRNCGAEGFGRLWRGEKCYCSSQCSRVAGANKRSFQRDIKNGLVAEDHVQINRACSQHADLLEDITSSEDELIVSDDEVRLPPAVPDRICSQSRRNSFEGVQAELSVPENIRNAAIPLFDVSDSATDDELNISETTAQFICIKDRATRPHFVERQASVDFIRECRSSVVKVEPQSFVPELSTAVTIHQVLSQTPVRGSDERERLQTHSPTNEANTAADSATEFVPAPRIRPNFRFLSISTITTIKQELLESRAQERSQSRTTFEQHAPIDNRDSVSNVSDEAFVDGFESPVCGQSKKSMVTNFEREANSSSDRTQVKDRAGSTSRRSSASGSDAVDKALENYMDSVAKRLWQNGTGLSMKSDFETDASLKKRAKQDSLSD